MLSLSVVGRVGSRASCIFRTRGRSRGLSRCMVTEEDDEHD